MFSIGGDILLKRVYRNITNGIYNLMRWFPVIWNDRDWDYHFVYYLLHKKLSHMESFYRSGKSYTAISMATADEIKIAREVLDRLIKGNHLQNALSDYHRIYGEDAKLWTTEPTDKGYKKLVWTDNKKQLNMFRKAGRHSEYMEGQDINYLFDYLKKHIQSWWD